VTDFEEVYSLYFDDVYKYTLSLCQKNKHILDKPYEEK